MTWPTGEPPRDDPYGPHRLERPEPEESEWARPGETPPYGWQPPSGQPYAEPQYGGQPQAGQPYAEPQYGGQPQAGQPYAGPYFAQPQAGQPYPPQYQQYGAPTQPPPGPTRRTNGLAIAALVCSLAGVVTGISAPVGAVLGHLASRQIAQTGEEGASLAKAAIWVGWILTGLIVVACCALLSLLLAADRTGQLQQ